MSEIPPFSQVFQSVINYLDSKDFNYSSYPEEKRITLSMSGKNANYRMVARVTHEEKYLQISTYFPFFVREEKFRGSVAELITRANYGMPVGKFEMDMTDGEVRFHVTHVIDGEMVSEEHIERLFMTSYYTTDRYFPAFMQHLHAGYTPEDAVFHAELDIHSERVAEGERPPVNKPRSKPKTSNAPQTPPAGSDHPAPSASRKSPRKRGPKKNEEKGDSKGEGQKDQRDQGDQGELPL